MMSVLSDFYDFPVLDTGYEFSSSGVYKQISPESDCNVSGIKQPLDDADE